MTRIILVACSLILLASQSAVAQSSEKGSLSWQAGSRGATREASAPERLPSATPQSRHTLRDNVNAGLVGLITGGMDGTDLEEAIDLSASLDGIREHLRILPVAGKGAFQNVTDLLFARGIDVGVIQSDVLAALKRDPPFHGIENFLQYITKLSDEEVHILARRNIRSVEDLASKKVNFGMRDSGTYMTANVLFGSLGITVDATSFPQPIALEKLLEGEISAMVYVVSKPARLFQDIKPEENLHFLSITPTSDLRERYASASLTAEDYPLLISAAGPVDTIAIGSILAVYNWPAGTERYRRVVHFVEAFLGRHHDLQSPPHNPKWRDVDVAASVPGWTRFLPAERWIRKAGLDNGEPTGSTRLHAGTTQGNTTMLGLEDRDVVFKDFIDHQSRKTHALNSAGLPDRRQLNALFTEFVEYQRRQTSSTSRAGFRGPRQLDALFTEFVEYQKRQIQTPGSARLLDPWQLDALFSGGRTELSKYGG